MDQSVIIKFENGHPDWTSFWAFAKVLEKAITEADLGEYDGHELELGGNEGTLFCYGPDADRLFSLIRPLVDGASFIRNPVATLRYGDIDDANTRTMTVHIRAPH